MTITLSFAQFELLINYNDIFDFIQGDLEEGAAAAKMLWRAIRPRTSRSDGLRHSFRTLQYLFLSPFVEVQEKKSV